MLMQPTSDQCVQSDHRTYNTWKYSGGGGGDDHPLVTITRHVSANTIAHIAATTRLTIDARGYINLDRPITTRRRDIFFFSR